MSSYESKLESSAGYCNDRSLYDGNILLSNNDFVATPYATTHSGVKFYYFGPGYRIIGIAFSSLACQRTVTDLYTANGAFNGNKQLSKPLALLTADEFSFAGSGPGGSNNRPKYHQNSFLCSGIELLSLSPSMRDSNSYTYVYRLNSNGSLNSASGLGGSRGVRPVISLMHHIQVTGGNGTATSPWTIE